MVAAAHNPVNSSIFEVLKSYLENRPFINLGYE
jgi:hypothetical protein